MKLYFEKSELPDITTLSESTIDEEIKNARFPKPRQVSRRRAAYFIDDIMEWARTRPVSDLPPPPNTGAKKRRPGAEAPAARGEHRGA